MAVIFRAVFALIYSIIYCLCALVAAGAGHGTMVPLLPILTWIFYLVPFLTLNKLPKPVFVILMAAHYSWILIFLIVFFTKGLDPNDYKYFDHEPRVVLFTIFVYLVGQAVAWITFARHGKQLAIANFK